MKRFKTAVIGLGFIGVAHVEALRRLGNVDVVAVCNRSHANEKAKALFIDKAYKDYRQMINDNHLDFVHICTPNNSHFEMAKYALESNVNVVLEKPLTLTVQEAEDLVKLSNQKHLICAVNFHNRLYPAIIHIKSLIQTHQIGDIISISGAYLQDWLLFKNDYSWRLDKELSGSTRSVADIGSHWMDLIEYVSGLKIVDVFATFKTYYQQRKKPIGHVESFSNQNDLEYEDIPIDTEDIASIIYKFDNGAIGNATFSQMAAGNKNNLNFQIYGTDASISWTLEDLENIKIGYRNQANSIIPKNRLMMKDALTSIDFPAGHMEGYADAMKQVFKEIYHINDGRHYANFDDGLRQMILCEKIYQSAKQNKWIKI